MPNVAASGGARRQISHTETRAPIEVVLSRIVYWVFGVIEVLIAMRFVLVLLGANADAAFVSFIYSVSGIFLAPFHAVFNTQTAAGATFEWSDLVALVVYALIAWGIVALIRVVSPRESAGTVEQVEETHDTTTTQP